MAMTIYRDYFSKLTYLFLQCQGTSQKHFRSSTCLFTKPRLKHYQTFITFPTKLFLFVNKYYSYYIH